VGSSYRRQWQNELFPALSKHIEYNEEKTTTKISSPFTSCIDSFSPLKWRKKSSFNDQNE